MKILVGCKRVIDYAVKIRVKPDNMGVVSEGVKHSMNPFDENALEEAIKLKEKKVCSEVIALSCGDKKSSEVLRTALAMGADRAIHVDTSNDAPGFLALQPIHVSKIFEKICLENKIDMVIVGKQAIDDDSNQTGQMLAARLKWPQAIHAYKIDVEKESMKVVKEIDGGLETIQLKLPAVVTCDLRLNQPRYATLPNIMKAKKKPLETRTLKDLGIEFKEHMKVLSVENPPARSGGIILNNVDDLISKLKEKGAL